MAPLPPPLHAPPRRLQKPLPPYRMVPGLTPHPTRDPLGHSFGHQPTMAPDTQWLWALDLFDHRYYWEAHEQWEALWHQAPKHTGTHRLLQGLIQSAAFVLKLHMGHRKAAKTLLQRAEHHLLLAGPTNNIDRLRLITDLHRFSRGGPWPCITPGARHG